MVVVTRGKESIAQPPEELRDHIFLTNIIAIKLTQAQLGLRRRFRKKLAFKW